MKRILTFSFLILTAACSSWQLKERCDKTNWFEYARDVAESGRYLEEDGFIKDCKGVDRINDQQIDVGFKSGRERYCTYESIFRNGEAGEPVNLKMCDNLILYQMQERYAEGLKNFCTAATGYTYGASGKVYKNVCIKREEEKFLPAYYKGRQEYLTKAMAQIQTDIASLQNLQTNLDQQISLLSREIQSLPDMKECHVVTAYNADTKSTQQALSCEEPFYIVSRRSSLYSQMDPLRSQYTDHSKIISKLMNELQIDRTELTKIPVAFSGLK